MTADLKAALFAAAATTLLCLPASAQIAADPDRARALFALGTELTPALAQGTGGIFGPLTAQQSTEGVTITRDIAYGPHERHRLDIYSPTGAQNAPVIIYLHGGGFVRGDKGMVGNIGTWFARHGVVGITMNYRYAPEIQWPAGAQDVAAALDWLVANIAAHGGAPDRIVVAGNSAGAMHVADYVFHEAHHLANDGVIGAVLLSPPTVDLTARDLDPTRDLQYYGAEGDRAAQSIINALDGRRIPLMIGYAELEPDVIMDQTRLLIEAVSRRDGRMPLVVSAPGHNHLSIASHIGSGDDTIAPDMLEFVLLMAARAQ